MPVGLVVDQGAKIMTCRGVGRKMMIVVLTMMIVVVILLQEEEGEKKNRWRCLHLLR